MTAGWKRHNIMIYTNGHVSTQKRAIGDYKQKIQPNRELPYLILPPSTHIDVRVIDWGYR